MTRRDRVELSERDRNGRVIVEVNEPLCRVIAERARARPIPIDREDIAFQGLPHDLLANFFLFIVAICHQTSPVGLPRLRGIVGGQTRTGWDYLLGKFHEQAKLDVELLQTERWMYVDEEGVRNIFSDPTYGCLLSNLAHRAALIRDLGAGMHKLGWKRVDQMHAACEGRIAAGHPNLLETLSSFSAYRDPIRKKSFFFLSLMRNTGHWDFVDADALGAPVDYHEVRGHLRIGTVRIVDPELLARVANGIEVSEGEDVAIRRAVLNAILLVSETSGVLNPSQIHYLFWNIFRGVCTRENPRCSSDERPPLLPDRYLAQLDIDSLFHCPFERNCASAHAPSPIPEHLVTTDYY